MGGPLHRGRRCDSRVIDSIRIPFQKGGERREGYPDRYILPFTQPLCIVRAYLERGYHSSVANSTSGNWHRTREGTRDAPMLSPDALIYTYICICLSRSYRSCTVSGVPTDILLSTDASEPLS